jgi:tetratricopeptide (TPR) repeat protein
MDPTEDLLRRYLELCTTFRDQPEVVPELERLRAEAASADRRPWPCFLDGRIAFVRGDYASALASFEAVLAADPEFVLATHMQGVCLGSLGRHEEALAACQRAISLFGDTEDLALQEQLAKVIVNKGATLGELGRHDDSIAACDQVLSRFSAAKDPALQEQVAKAIINRGVSFGELGRHQEEVAAYDEVIARFGPAEDLRLREQVAWAMVNRGIALGELDRRADELAAYDEVISRFGDAEDLALREAVAEAMFNRQVAVARPGRETGRAGTQAQPVDAGEEAEDAVGESEEVATEAPKAAPRSAAGLVERIHAAPGRVVLVVSGGGSRALAELLEVPGASRTLLEAVVPYCEEALIAWLGGRPEAFCSAGAARAMAMIAFRRASDYEGGRRRAAGVACTASLATDRPKRGAHRVHLALQTARRTATWSLQLKKGRRSRADEEQLVGRLLINTLAEACRVKQRLPLDLLKGEQIDRSQTVAPRPWQDLLLGRVETVCAGGMPARAILPGAFNPLHVGHRRMAEIAGQVLGTPVVMELSIVNVDKPPLDYQEIERRLGQFAPQQRVCLTRAATFEEKSTLFPGATFIVGVDTLRRIADSRYYGDESAACLAAIERIAARGCRFLVFSRNVGTGFMRLSDLDLPEALRAICREVPAEECREDVSSTEIRKSGGW